MKIDSIVRQKMKEDIAIMVNYFFPIGISELSIGNMHNVWFKVFSNRKYDDKNPNVIFIDGVRLLSYDEHYELYPCDSNDNSLQTALISIFKELGVNKL